MLSFSPYAHISEVPVQQAFNCVLQVLQHWGFIRSFRFDNGRPFADPTRQSLSICALRLLAMGIQPVINPPRHPTYNAKVERCQGTTGRWADAAKCADIQQFGKRLAYAVKAQRERLPSRVCEGKTRAQYFPELFTNPLRFDPHDFKIQRVFQHLATGCWQRRISPRGGAVMFGAHYQVGFPHRGKDILIKLNPVTRFWCFYDKDWNLLNELPVKNITTKNLYALSFSQ